MNFKTRINNLFLSISLILLICQCAKIQPPPGGPEDKTSPEIFETRPSSGSTKVPLDTDVEIIFSKSMKNTVTEKALHVSPLFFDYPEFHWSGKKVKIILPEKLKPNTTYVLTIGASASDNRGNKLGKTVSIPFSTGEILYTSAISGKALSERFTNYAVWAYKLESANPELFWMKLPDYVTQTDSLGEFNFEHLSYGTYLVVVVSDKNNDQFWAPPAEKLALPIRLVTLSESNPTYGPLIMVPVDRDTLKPQLSRIISPDNRIVRLEFSQKMDTIDVLNRDNFNIFISGDTITVLKINRIYPSADDFKAIFLECSELNDGEKYELVATGVKSVYGVVSDTLVRFFNAGTVDTIPPEINSISPRPPGRSLRPGFDIVIWFSEAMDTSDTDEYISISDTNDIPVQFDIGWNYPNNLVINPGFQTDNVYILSIDAESLTDKASNPLGDTTVVYKYYIASADTFGIITGKVVNYDDCEIIVIARHKQGEENFAECDNEGKFIFENLFPGVYNIRAFCDLNRNGVFNGGKISPFKFAEPVTVYEDTVEVRARWETDIGAIDFLQ